MRHVASGETWTLSEGRLIVARKAAAGQLHLEPGDAPLALDDDLVSRRHAVIEAEGGRFWITDANSTDGTFVNDTRINQRTPIGDGDSVRFGDSRLTSVIERVSPTPAPTRGRPPAEDTFQSRPAPLPVAKIDPEKTMLQEPPVVRATASSEVDLPFTPVPKGAGTLPRPQITSETPSAVIPSVVQSVVPSATAVQVAPTASPASADDTPFGVSARARLGDVASVLRELQRDAALVADRFEQAGGRRAIESIRALSTQLQGSIVSREDVDALLKELPTVSRLLQVELELIDLISSRGSDAPR
jgi:predicted component of type VI protein secretion system